MANSKNAQPGVTDIAWALMRKWAASYDMPVETLGKHFEWAVELAKSYSKASPVVINRQVGAFL